MPISVLSPLVPGATGVVIASQLIIPIVIPTDSNVTLTNMPSAEGWIQALDIWIARNDLTLYRQARLVVRKMATAGATGAKLVAKYSTVNPNATYTSSDWNDLGTSEISCAINVSNQVIVSSWINLAAGAKADVYFTVVGTGGDGVADPVIGQVSVQVR